MTIQHIAKVFEAHGFYGAAQKLVLLEIAYRCDRKGILRHSQAEIAADTGLSRRTVAQWFHRFEEVGMLDREGHGRYRLIPEAFEDDISPLLAPPQKPLRMQPGAEAELERLKTVRRPGQGIAFSDEGWPVLIETSA